MPSIDSVSRRRQVWLRLERAPQPPQDLGRNRRHGADHRQPQAVGNLRDRIHAP